MPSTPPPEPRGPVAPDADDAAPPGAPRSRPATIVPAAFVAVVGILVGLGTYTFVYARGYSYLFDDPTACVNCHVMREQYQTWEISSHRGVTCNGCHTPHDLVGKYLVKAENGFAHAWVFTLGDPQVIQIRHRSRAVVEANCVECHTGTIAGTFLDVHHGKEHGTLDTLKLLVAPPSEAEGPRCSTCHSDVGHVLR
jgi:cytochrome c nitrite reductase small subunit